MLSGGRVGLGIGAAWNDEESGFAFPPTAERFERLEEAIQICLQMWSGSDAAFDGKHYQLGRTLNVPQVLQRPRPYLMIGGGGEKKTLRTADEFRPLGFAAAYVFARDITDRASIIDRLGAAVPRLA